MKTRNEELDEMSIDDKKEDLLNKLAEHSVIRFTTKTQIDFWGEALSLLVDEGKVSTKLVEVDDQESYLRAVLA